MSSIEQLPSDAQEVWELPGFAGAKVFRKEPMVNSFAGGRGSYIVMRPGLPAAVARNAANLFQPRELGQQTIPQVLRNQSASRNSGDGVGSMQVSGSAVVQDGATAGAHTDMEPDSQFPDSGGDYIDGSDAAGDYSGDPAAVDISQATFE